jgi:hypothetical protein
VPNHITNIINAESAVIHALLTEEGVDFRRVIPTPEGYIEGNCSHRHASTFAPGPETEPLCWYVWNREHWGTKWNAYSYEVREGDCELKFETAWNHPWPVIEALSRRFPAETIHVRYADEDLGSNLGEYDMRDGQLVGERLITPGSDEANDFACLLVHGQTYDEFEAEWSS